MAMIVRHCYSAVMFAIGRAWKQIAPGYDCCDLGMIQNDPLGESGGHHMN